MRVIWRDLFLAAALAMAVFFVLPGRGVQAATCTWDGSDNNWNKDNNWSCTPALSGKVGPTAADAVIINGGKVTLTQAAAALSLTLNGGTLDLNGKTLAAGANAPAGSDVLVWTGGSIAGGGTLTVAQNTKLQATLAAQTLSLSATTLTANGPLSQHPLITLQVTGGALNLNGAGALDGAISADATSTVTVNSPVSLAGGAPFNTGTLVVNSTLDLLDGAPLNAGNLNLQSGAITGAGPVTVTGAFTWGGGALKANTTTAGLDFTTTGGARVLDSCTLTASGAAQNGAGSLALIHSAGLNLNGGGKFGGSFTSDPTSSLALGSGQTLTIGGGALFDGPLTAPSGTLAFSSGTVIFGSAGVLANMHGEIASANQAALYLPALGPGESLHLATLTLGDASIAAAVLPLPSLTLRSALSVDTLNWGGGKIQWSGAGAPAEIRAGALNLYAQPDKTLDGLPLTVAGATTWTSSGRLNLDSNALFTSLGVVSISSSGSTLLSTGTGLQPGSFANQGVLSYANPAAGLIAVEMTGSGALSVMAGTLQLARDLTQSGSLTIQAGGALDLAAGPPVHMTVSGSYQIAGVLNANNGSLAFLPTSAGSFAATSALQAASGGSLTFSGGAPVLHGTYDNQGASIFDQASEVSFGATASLASLGSTVTVDSARVTLPATGAGSLAIDTLDLLAGSLSSPDALAITHLNWAGGALSGGAAAGPPATSLGQLTFTGSASRRLENRSLVIGSDPAGMQGNLQLSQAAVLTFSIGGALAAGLSADASSTVRFDNSDGTPLDINGSYAVAGTSAFAGGAVNINSAATLSQLGGTVTVAGGALTLNSGETLPPVASLTLSAGTLGGSDALSVGTFDFSEGSFNGTGGLSVTVFNWSGGTLSGEGGTPVPQATAGTLNFSGSSARTLAHRQLTATSVNTGGGGSLALSDSAAFILHSGALDSAISIDATSTLELNSVSPSFSGRPSGTGTLRLVDSSIISSGAFSFEGALVIVNSSVTLTGGGVIGRIDPGGAPAGGITADSRSRLEFNGGSGATTTLHGIFDNAGETIFSSGTVGFGSAAVVTRIGSPVTIRGASVSLPASDPPTPQTISTLNLSSGQLSGTGDFSISTLNLSGGLLSGAGDFSIGVLNWSGGELDGAGSISLPATGVDTLNPAGGADLRLSNRAMTVTSALSGSGTKLVLSAGASLHLSSGGAFNLPLELESSSTLRFSGAPVTVEGAIDGPGRVIFEHDATLHAAYTVSGETRLVSGQVTFTNGATFGGSLSAGAASALIFSGGSAAFSSGATLSLAGSQVIVNGASASLALPAAPVSLGDLTLSAGSLSGSAAVEVASLHWSGGTLRGAGAVAPALRVLTAPLDLSGGGDRFLDGFSLAAGQGVAGGSGSLALIGSSSLALENGGALSVDVSLNSSSVLRIDGQAYTISGGLSGPGAVIFGAASPATATISGSYDITGTTTFQAGAITFSTAARLTHLGSTVTIRGASVTAEAAFNNDGAIDLQSGALSLNNGGSIAGSILIGSAGALHLNAGSFALNASLSGGGGFTSGGNTTLHGAVDLSGPSTIDGGALTLSASANLQNLGAPLILRGGATVRADSAFNNTGAIRLANATLTLHQGGTLANASGPVEGISLDADSLLEFTGGTLTLAADVSGAGTLRFGSLTGHTLAASLSGSYNLSGASQFYSATAAPPNTVTFQAAANLQSLGAAVTVDGAAVNLPDKALHIPHLTLAGGRLSGPAAITAGALDWSGGQMDGAAAATRPATQIGDLTVSGLLPKALDRRDAVISGAVAWTSSGALNLDHGATLTSEAAFSVTSSGATLLATTSSSQPGRFTNTGSFRIETGGSTQIGVPFTNAGTFDLRSSQLSLNTGVFFDNPGTLNMQSGQLSLYAGGLFSGSTTVDERSWLRFSLGSFTLETTSSLSGAGKVSFEFGTAVVRGAYHLSGSSFFSNGQTTFESRPTPQELGSSVTVNGGVLILNTGQRVSIPNLVLSSSSASTVAGPDPLTVATLDWSAGAFRGPNAGELLVTRLNYSGTLPHTLSGRTLKLSGDAQWTGMGTLVLSQAVFHNLPGAALTLDQGQDSVVMAGPASGEDVAFINGGAFHSSGARVAQINVPLTNTGQLEVLNGTLVINQAFVQETGGVLDMNGGALQVNSSNQTLNLNGGRLTGSGIIYGSLVNQGALVEPGSPFGALQITGQYQQQAGGALGLDLSAGAFDQLAVGGAVRLGGTLAATLSEPPEIAPPRSFPVMTFASLTGRFTTLKLPDLGSERSLLPFYETARFSLAVIDRATESDLSIRLANNRGLVVIGHSATYTLTVTNLGPMPANGAVVSAAFPADGVTAIYWRCTAAHGQCAAAGGSDPVETSLNLEPGGQATLTITVQVADTPPDPFVVTAQIDYPVDPDQTNNHAEDSQATADIGFIVYLPLATR